MTQLQKKESLTKLLRVSDKNQNYFITTDQVTGKRFALAEFGEPGSVNIKSNFMNFKEMESFLFGINAVINNTLKLESQHQTKLPIYWSTADFEGIAEKNFKELKEEHPEEFLKLESWEQLYDKTKFPEALAKMIKHHDATIGTTWLTVEEYLGECEIKQN